MRRSPRSLARWLPLAVAIATLACGGETPPSVGLWASIGGSESNYLELGIREQGGAAIAELSRVTEGRWSSSRHLGQFREGTLSIDLGDRTVIVAVDAATDELLVPGLGEFQRVDLAGDSSEIVGEWQLVSARGSVIIDVREDGSLITPDGESFWRFTGDSRLRIGDRRRPDALLVELFELRQQHPHGGRSSSQRALFRRVRGHPGLTGGDV